LNENMDFSSFAIRGMKIEAKSDGLFGKPCHVKV